MEGRVYIVNIKSWTSLNFYVYTQPFSYIASILFTLVNFTRPRTRVIFTIART